MMHSISGSIVFEAILVTHMACHLSMIISVENASLITVPFQHFYISQGSSLMALMYASTLSQRKVITPMKPTLSQGGTNMKFMN